MSTRMRTRMLAAAALAATTLLMGTVSASANVPAAINVVVGTESMNEVSIAADGSYQVVFHEEVELAGSTRYSFGGTIHDGFRLPDDGSVIPPYLRASYAAPEATIDGSAVKAGFTRHEHAVSIAVGEDFDKGNHRGTIRYDVTSAAVPTSDGYVVYFRPLKGGVMTFTATDEITSVECVDIPPEAARCGRASDGTWIYDPDRYDDDRLGAAGVVKITVKGDSTGVPEPNIDYK